MRLLPVLLTLAFAAACGRPPTPGTPAPAASCQVLRAAGAPDSVIVGVPGPVDFTHAPAPATEAERFVFGTLYEPLVRLDCEGRAGPALASRWSQEGARRWRFTLREDARFWDGSPVTARDVAAAWAGRSASFAESLTTPDPRTMVVVLHAADTAALRRFADPRLAITKPGRGAIAALGTTPYRITRWETDGVDAAPVNRPAPVLELRLAAGADARDLVDQGADLVLTDDPEALRYAGQRQTTTVVPLPWTLTYVLAGPWVIQPADATAFPGLLAAVRAEARLVDPPFWWTRAPPCDQAPPAGHDRAPEMAGAIAYVATDPVARDLASRLAALSAQGQAVPGAGPLHALGLRPAAFAETVAADRVPEFILALRRRSYATCRSLPGAVVPLVDTRSSVIARPGRVGVVVDWDGTPRIVPP